MSAEAPIDFDTFASPFFDSNDYANAILAREPYNPSPAKTKPVVTVSRNVGNISSEVGKEDISMAIAKLNFAIDDVAKQLKTLVIIHHEALLAQASTVTNLERSLGTVRHGLSQVEVSLERLKLKIQVPHAALASHVVRLQRLQTASDVLRRTSRFLILARRLEVQMSELDGERKADGSFEEFSEEDKERAIAKAALSVAELVTLFSSSSQSADGSAETDADSSDSTSAVSGPIPLPQIRAVARHMPSVEAARVKVTAEMESMVSIGLRDSNQSMLASSLQTAYNLGVLPKLVQSLIVDLTDAIDGRIRSAFDVSKISRDVNQEPPPSTAPSLIYRSRVRTEPTNITVPQWTQALWSRLETLVEDMASCCVKVYTLEKVLQRKRDPTTGVLFLEEGMKLLENKPSSTFWMTLAQAIEKHSRESAKNSTFLQQTLSTSYPRLLRLFHDFFSKIAVHTDTVYTSSQQSPETVLILRSISSFESLYLSRSTVRLNEAVSTTVSNKDGIPVARTVANELDKARFDPLLVRSVARNSVASLDGLVSRMDALLIRDRLATSLAGPTTTTQQVTNAQIISALYQCWLRLTKLQDEFHESVWVIIEPGFRNIQLAYQRASDPLLYSIRRETAAIISRLHRVDYGKPFEASAMGGSNIYMDDLLSKLTLVKTDILPRFDVGDLGREWVISIAKHVLRQFVLHASIAKPLGEGGKLQLTTEMTEVEFALNSFVAFSDGSQRKGSGLKLEMAGNDFKALRGLRPLLFLDTPHLSSPAHTAGVPPLIVLHHIFVRSPIPMPHATHAWSEAEYVRWVIEHEDRETWQLIEGCLARWEKKSTDDSAQEFVDLARQVLRLAHEGQFDAMAM